MAMALDEKQKERIKVLYKQQVSASVIADRMGISACTVLKHCKELRQKPKTFICIDPAGNEYPSDNLPEFCRKQRVLNPEINLNPESLSKCANGSQLSHRNGWTCRYAS